MRTRVFPLLLALATLATTTSLTTLSGCARKARTPAEAYQRFVQAVASGDAGALYDALDPDTRWAWMTIQKWHREAYDIVLSNFPEGTARDRELRRFQGGATASSGRELFRAEEGATLRMLAPLAAADATIEADPSAAGDSASAVLVSGIRVPLRRGQNGGWGYGGLYIQADERKNRAYHDLELVRASAADYERAAARAAAR